MKLRLTLTKTLIIIAVVAFLLGLLIPIYTPLILFDPKPKLPPNEKNRIHHPNGFSIIAPKGWQSVILSETGEEDFVMSIFPKRRARFLPSLTAIRYKNSEEAHHQIRFNEYQKSMILGLEAEIFEGRSARYHAWHAIFAKDDMWYGIWLMLPHGKHGSRYEKVPDYWWPFIESFRIDNENLKPEQN